MTLAAPRIDGIRESEVDAAGLRMHVVEAGPPDGDPVLVLHGWPQHWYQWRHQIPALAAAGYRVIVPDLRGFGQTEAPPRGLRQGEHGDRRAEPHGRHGAASA